MKKPKQPKWSPKLTGQYFHICLLEECKEPFNSNKKDHPYCRSPHRKRAYYLRKKNGVSATIRKKMIADPTKNYSIVADGSSAAVSSKAVYPELFRLLVSKGVSRDDVILAMQTIITKSPKLFEFRMKSGSRVIVKEHILTNNFSGRASKHASPDASQQASHQVSSQASPETPPIKRVRVDWPFEKISPQELVRSIVKKYMRYS